MNHAYHQTDLPLEMQILNISVNLARIGNWIESLYRLREDKGEEIYQSRIKLIQKMIDQTDSYLSDLKEEVVSEQFSKTLNRFREDFTVVKKQAITKKNHLFIAEKALTWANILQNRAKLA